jgi:hypothetical protein
MRTGDKHAMAETVGGMVDRPRGLPVRLGSGGASGHASIPINALGGYTAWMFSAPHA